MPPKGKRKAAESIKFDDDYIDGGASDEEYLVDKRPYGDRPGRKPGQTKANQLLSISTTQQPQSLDITSSSGFEFYQDLSKSLTLKKDHDKRPIWITKNNVIILEAFSKYYTQAYDFLIDISEPISRPTYFQTYQLTEDSLYSAVAVSRSTESIIKYLNILCKTEVPSEVETFIRNCTSTFGKVSFHILLFIYLYYVIMTSLYMCMCVYYL